MELRSDLEHSKDIMIIVKTKEELRKIVGEIRRENRKIGFVPTMGFLHEGHLSIISESKAHSDFTIVSIFVNPIQFNDPGDYENYPKSFEEDLKKCGSLEVDLVYMPEIEEMYPNKIPKIDIKIPELMKNLCGKTRPGHFEGVMLVVSKLFHHVNPDIAFFGMKDYQQLVIVKELVYSLDFPIEIKGIETVREKDGLAMSSRNSRLNEEEREAACLIPRSLKIAEEEIFKGERNSKVIIEIIRDILISSNLLRVDYIEIVDPSYLQSIEVIEKNTLVALAVFSGSVRLIDNKIIRL